MKRIAAVLGLLVVLGCKPEHDGGEQPRLGRTLSAPPLPPADFVPEAGPGDALSVVSARPQGQLGGLARATITFSKPMVALAMLEDPKAAQGPAARIALAPAAAGAWRWLGSSSVEFVPEAPLRYSNAFVVTVPAGLQALDGSRLAEAFTFSFRTPVLEVDAGRTAPNTGPCRFSTPDQLFQIFVNQPVADPAKAFRFEAGAQQIAATVVKAVNVQDEARGKEAQETDPAKKRQFARASTDDLQFKSQVTRYELKPAQPLPRDAGFAVVLDGAAHGAAGPLAGIAWRQQCRTYGAFQITGAELCDFEAENRHCPNGPLLLRLSNPLGAAAELKSRLHLDPPAPIDWAEPAKDAGDDDSLGLWLREDRSEVVVPARLKPGTKYQLTIDAGVKDPFGQQAPAFTATVTTDDLLASVYIGRERGLLEAAGDGALPVQLTNIGELDADLWQLTPQSYAQMLFVKDSAARFPLAAPDARPRDKVTYPRNEPHLHGLDLRQALHGRKTGLVIVKLWSPDAADPEQGVRGREPERALLQLTDLAVHAKIGVTSGLAWVTSVASGAPVPGATVRVYNRAGVQVAEVTSDASGFAALPPLAQLEQGQKRESWDSPALLVAATLGEDTGVISTQWSDQLRPDVAIDFDALARRAVGVIFADRGIYRPGDTAHVKGLLRRLTAAVPGGLETPAEGTRVTVEVTEPGGRKVVDRQVTLTHFGSFEVEVAIPRDARLGTFAVLAREPKGAGTTRDGWYGDFRVAEYRPPQFRVDVLSDPKDLAAGDSLKATVSARYLFGAPMNGAAASWSVSRYSESFTPPRNDSFTFGRETWGYDEGEPAHDSGLFASGKGTVDALGTLAVAGGNVEAMADRAATYTVEAEVQDVSRQTVAGRTSVLVHPASFYVGVGKKSLFLKTGEALKLPIVAARPDGARVGAVAVKLTALLRSWHSVRKKGVGGVYQEVAEPVDEKGGECAVTTNSQDPADCTLTLQKVGFYTLRAEAKDEKGRTALTTTGIYALGQGFVAWQRGDSSKVELVPDKSEYEVGDTAHVLIKSPYPEANALVSLEREGVLEKRLVKLTGTATAIDVPITEAMVPNLFVAAVLVRGRVEAGGAEPGDDPGRPGVRVGTVELNVGKRTRKLQVTLTTPRKDYKPRETVQVKLQVVDSAKRGVRSEVAVYAVDEGVLRLTDYKVPDPIASMFPHRGLSVALGEPLVSLVRRQRFGEKGEVQPGGGGGREGSGDVRSKFLTTVLWKTVVTGADGTAEVSFELPDNLTTFRLMAVAATDGDRFGSGEAAIQVALPLLVLPALPRFARVGDAFEAGVVVHAHGAPGNPAEVTVTAEVTGAVALAPGQGREQRVSVEEGVAREVRFKLVATGGAPGDKLPAMATLRFRASTGQGASALTDAIEQRIPVQLPVGLEAVAVYGDTDGKREEGLVPPESARPGIGGLTVTLSSSALGGLGEGMSELVDYPYGCLEQLSSRLVPFIALQEVSRIFGVDAGKSADKAEQARRVSALYAALLGHEDSSTAATDPDRVVAETVAKIEQLQTPSGGFRYWPGSGCPTAWASIYATMALHRASEVGYAVKPQTLALAKRFLARKAEGQGSCPYERVGPETRVFALQVLARMGEPRPADYDELYLARDKLPLFAKALLADAMFIGKGKRDRARVLLQDVLDHAQETPGEVHFAEQDAGTYAPLFSSDTRTTGMVLQTLVDVQPAHPFVGKIARYLTSVRRGGKWRNTQEAAYALMGLTEVVRVKERSAPDFSARVLLAGKELTAQKFSGRSLDVVTKKIPIDDMKSLAGGSRKPEAGSLPFVFAAEGTGTLTYGALLRYAPTELPMKPRDEGFFVQRWIEPFDAAGKAATEFAAGELVRVRLRVATRQERNYVAVEVPLPAGFEAVDTQLATSAQRSRSAAAGENGAGEEGGEEGGERGGEEGYDDQAPSFWSPFLYSEKRDDRVVYFAEHLPPGVHLQTFVARATTPGRFLLKPAQAEEMYAPEVFGRSEGGEVTISAARPVAAR